MKKGEFLMTESYLVFFKSGEYIVKQYSSLESKTKNKIASIGIIPGKTLKIIETGQNSIIVSTGDCRIILDRRTAEKIVVETIDDVDTSI